AAGAGEALRSAIFLFDLVILYLLDAGIANHSDKSFVQDRIAGGLAPSVPLDEGKGVDGNRLRGLVLNAVGHREHVTVIDCDFAVKDEALAIIVSERHWGGFGERLTIGLPQRIVPGQDKVRARIGEETCLDVIRRRRIRRREQDDMWTIGIDR